MLFINPNPNPMLDCFYLSSTTFVRKISFSFQRVKTRNGQRPRHRQTPRSASGCSLLVRISDDLLRMYSKSARARGLGPESAISPCSGLGAHSLALSAISAHFKEPGCFRSTRNGQLLNYQDQTEVSCQWFGHIFIYFVPWWPVAPCVSSTLG